MVLVMNIDGVLDRPTIGAAGVISGERAPTDDFVIRDGDGDRMFVAVVDEPMLTAFQRLGLFLIGAGRVEYVMIVDVVDGF